MPAERHDPDRRWFRRMPIWVTALLIAGAGAAIAVVAIEVSSATDRDITAPFTVVYSVTGSVATADIGWYQDAGADHSGSGSVNAHALPWRRTSVVDGSFPTFTLTAMASTSSQSGELTCTITVNGALRSTQTLGGTDPSVACDDSETGG